MALRTAMAVHFMPWSFNIHIRRLRIVVAVRSTARSFNSYSFTMGPWCQEGKHLAGERVF